MVDRFGIKQEQRIMESGIRRVFTPSRPVVDIELLFEREGEVARLLAVPGTPGRHAIIFGQRGVGKSSLARASQILLTELFSQGVITVPCDASTTFERVVGEPLRRQGRDLDIVSTEIAHASTTEGHLGAPVVGGSHAVQSTRSETTSRPAISPSEAVGVLKSTPQLLVIDEADAIQSSDVHLDIAEFIKLLSDEDSAFRVLVVGIADTVMKLTGNHPSVQRCLEQIHLSKLTDKGVRTLVTSGFASLNMSINPAVVRSIVYCSDGLPHFAHLLSLNSGEIAIGSGRTHVEESDLKEALLDAARSSEADLQDAYSAATLSARTDAYRDIVAAAATVTTMNFSSDQLRSAYRQRTGQILQQNALNNYLGRLLSADSSTIFTRVAQGVYRFTDPRMPSYVRILNSRSD